MSNAAAVPGRLVPGRAVPGDPSGTSPPPGWPSHYITNFCPNPSVEDNANGYAARTGAETLAQDSGAWTGVRSLKVTTPGHVPGEGVITPAGSVYASAQGSASLYIYGDTGLLTVSAVQNPGGQVLASVPVQPDPAGWQRVELNQLPLTGGSTFMLTVETATAQALTYWVDGVQYEPESPCNPYVDGDQAYAAWETTGTDSGTLRASARMGAPLDANLSYQDFANPTSATGGMTLDGVIEVTVPGAVYQTGPVTGLMDASGQQHPMTAVSSPGHAAPPPAIDPGVPGLPWEIAGGGSITSAVTVSPGSCFGEFAVWQTGADPDPAMSLIGPSNTGIMNASSSAAGYNQVYAAFTAPVQRLDSGGNQIWQAAAYMAAGFAVSGQAKWSAATPNGVNFTQVQVEKATGTVPGPYQRPRSLSVTVKPTIMNYVPNPSLEAALDGWTAFGGATLTRVTGGAQGGFSLQVSVPGQGAGAYIVIPQLITGDTFTASAYVSPVTANIADIILTAGSTAASANPTGYPFGGGDYGAGPYGGINAAAAPMTTATWEYRPWTALTAPQSAVTLALTPVAVTGATYPLTFLADCAMVTPGETLTPYGDGSSDGWQWELGGTPGLARSYYYERESTGARAVQSVLDQHVPLGLSAAAPRYAVPPSQ